MPVFWLSENELTFPHPELANEDGIVAIGGDLSVERLLLAYQMGLFPWFNPQDPILWWSPDPRFVLFPNELKVAKSMRPYFNQNKFQVTFDQEFEKVIRGCQEQRRRGQMHGTWISDSMVDAYCQLHEAGYAHSVEVYEDQQLVAGLYGVSIGKVYYGESMFTKVSNASKFGFITLTRKLDQLGFWLIDCQQHTQHLESLGGRPVSRQIFLDYMLKNQREQTLRGNWEELLNK